MLHWWQKNDTVYLNQQSIKKNKDGILVMEIQNGQYKIRSFY